MLVSCHYCGGRHARGHVCPNKPPKNRGRQKEANYITCFRSSMAWQKKRNEIKTRDKFLCSYCKEKGKYIFDKLEVHHITPISKKWNERLENSNLITLCISCHKLAENGNIKAYELKELAKNADAFRGPLQAF